VEHSLSEKIEFRPLRDDELEAGYALFTLTMQWLTTKALPHPVPWLAKEDYVSRQERGENFGLFVNGELAVIVSIVTRTQTRYGDDVGDAPKKWICSLAVGDGFHGQDLGRRAMEAAETHAAAAGEKVLYLSCYQGAGVLPRYYESLGYSQASIRDYVVDGEKYPILAMRKEL
jgi:GNAT superfamily N-acetyltransferase